MQLPPKRPNLPMALTGVICLCAGIAAVAAVATVYRSRDLLGAACLLIVFGTVLAAFGSRWQNRW